MLSSRRLRRVIPALLSVSLAACAGKPAAPAPGPAVATAPSVSPPAAKRVRIDQQLITRDVIRSTQYTNMYDVVLALRSNWLRVRPAESIQGQSPSIQVYLDNQRLAGGADELRQLSPTNIESVRYFDPITASARWGMDHGAGALYVTTAKR
jgi:hypothetical protein